MKDWFPLTNYDFYAYLTAGMVVLAAYDHAFMGSWLAQETHWTIVAGVFWAAVAYLLGQVLAIPSSALLELWLARRVLRPPSEILLGLQPPRRRERFITTVCGAREYRPFPAPNQICIRQKIAEKLGVDAGTIDAEAAFQCAFPHARGVADTATRLDGFLNQYGMCRNVSLAAGVAAIFLAIAACRTHDWRTTELAGGAIILSVGLFFRFIKFYAAYAREVFRTYDKCAA